MADAKKKILTVRDKRFHGFDPRKNANEPVFEVLILKNTTAYIIGSCISQEEINRINRNKDWEVNVKG